VATKSGQAPGAPCFQRRIGKRKKKPGELLDKIDHRRVFYFSKNGSWIKALI